MALSIDVRGVDALASELRALGDEAPNAVLRALRRSRTTIMARLGRWVAQASGLPVRRVRKSIHGSQPQRGKPDVTVTLWGGRDPLIRYATSLQREGMPRSAFRAKMPHGHVGFYERRPGEASRRSMPGRARAKRIRPGVWHSLPIDEVYGPPFTAFISTVGLEDLLRYGGEVFKQNLEREIAYRAGKSAA